MASETGARQYIRDAHVMLYKLFDVQQKNDSAYHHLRLYTALKETIDADQAEQKLAFFRSEIETEKAQAGIDRLTERKTIAGTPKICAHCFHRFPFGNGIDNVPEYFVEAKI